MSLESDLIAWLRSRVPQGAPIRVGIGDDAAILQLTSPQCVVTTDMLMEGVDFRLQESQPRRIGRKALAVNLSDLAAMAARPLAAFVSLAIPADMKLQDLQEIYEGILGLADEHRVSLAGGDTNRWPAPLAISVTAVGEGSPRGALLRSGGKPGDAILATGEFGGSLLGRHFDFSPRVAEALTLRERYDLHAGIDVSDGLSLDLSRLAKESGCGAVIDLRAVPISAAAEQLARQHGGRLSPLDHALGDGEDFELLLAVPPAEAARMLHEQPLAIPLTRIGELIHEPGLWAQNADGQRSPLSPQGYEHQ